MAKFTSATWNTRIKSPGSRMNWACAGKNSTGWCTPSRLPITVLGPKPFHETPKKAFLQAVDISCYSLIAISNALKDLLDADASVVTISISTTQMASENYGYMAPIKAALDSSLAFLAKSFSRFSRIRFNAVAPGLLENFRLGRHSRVCGRLSLRRAGHSPQKSRANRRSGQCSGISFKPPVQRHQCPANQ